MEARRQINESQAALMRKKRESAREVGLHVSCSDLKTKRKFRDSLKAFLKGIFPRQFYRPFSKDQLKFISMLQDVLTGGGQDCIALPRGDGKTTIMRGGALWAILTGRRRYPVIVAADQGKADQLMEPIKTMLETNSELLKYYPEACHYARALEGLPQRAAGQLANGKATRISWGSAEIQFAQVPMDVKKLEFCGGAMIQGFGITSGVRGIQITLADGETIRPDLVLLDDPQTRETANSPTQTNERLHIIQGDLAGLSGVERKMAMLAAVTVIRECDLADKLLNIWRSVRGKALDSWPREKDGLWRDYIDLRKEAKRNSTADELTKACNAFYRKNRKAMDEGAKAANPHRKADGDLSAVQTCYNYIADNDMHAFNAEWQNEPTSEHSTIYKISIDSILKTVNGRRQGDIPSDCLYVNAGIDINYYAMGWAVVASQNDMASFVIDYGLWPGRGKEIWSEGSPITLQQAIFENVQKLIAHILERCPAVKLFAFDGNFETVAVYGAVKQARMKFPGVHIMPARGIPSEKYSLPYRSKDLIRTGANCHLSRSQRGIDNLIFDSHYWHMQTQKGFLLSPGAPGSVSLFGDRNTPHVEFASHVCADVLLGLENKAGRDFYQWTKKPGEKNELGDALAMAAMASSVYGADINAAQLKAQRQPEPSVPFMTLLDPKLPT